MGSFSSVVEQLQGFVFRRGISYCLSTFSNLLLRLGNPHLKLPFAIHVAGTNGKGSTAQFIASGLQSCGYSVGVYSSPHLFSYQERLKIDGKMINEFDFCRFFNQVQSVCDDTVQVTEFEILTAMMFLYFCEQKPDYCILEVGLGGLFDATNVVESRVSVITSIALDHQSILGDRLLDIAYQKAGIIKPDVAVSASSCA